MTLTTQTWVSMWTTTTCSSRQDFVIYACRWETTSSLTVYEQQTWPYPFSSTTSNSNCAANQFFDFILSFLQVSVSIFERMQKTKVVVPNTPKSFFNVMCNEGTIVQKLYILVQVGSWVDESIWMTAVIMTNVSPSARGRASSKRGSPLCRLCQTKRKLDSFTVLWTNHRGNYNSNLERIFSGTDVCSGQLALVTPLFECWLHCLAVSLLVFD